MEYDYVIIGGGTAGCVLANRLSEDPEVEVLIIEAGEHRPDDALINTPGLMAGLYDDPKYDWAFKTVPQEHANDRVVGHPRGKVLGGSSAIQYGMIIYPSEAGIDAWSKLGNSGWSWKDMAPYYRKFSKLHLPSIQQTCDLALEHLETELYGSDGPIEVSFADQDFYGPVQKAWTKTFQNLGLKATGDPASGRMHGAYINPCSVNSDKTRSYAATSYITQEVLRRSNLTIRTETHALKILFTNKVASGVLVLHGEAREIVKIKGEVILCAGTIQSPQILELSGVGSPELLSRHGIDVVYGNASVGENLQDHAVGSIAFEVIDGIPTVENIKTPGVLDQLIAQYNSSRTGPLTSSAIMTAFLPINDAPGIESNGTVRERLLKLLDTRSNGQEKVASLDQQHALLREIVADPSDSTIQYFAPLIQLNPRAGPRPSDWMSMREDGHYITIGASLSHPFSRGSIHIASADPLDKPVIDPKYLSQPADLEILAQHVLYIENIARTEPLASLLKTDGRRVPRDAKLKSVQEAREYVRDTLVSTWHPTSTCSMLPMEAGGVVDTRLRVYGVERLRVVDASIFPLIPRGNIQTTVYAVAERAADMIKEARLTCGGEI